MNTNRMSNGLDPDQDRRSVGPDLGPTVCKGLSVINKYIFFLIWMQTLWTQRRLLYEE